MTNIHTFAKALGVSFREEQLDLIKMFLDKGRPSCRVILACRRYSKSWAMSFCLFYLALKGVVPIDKNDKRKGMNILILAQNEDSRMKAMGQHLTSWSKRLFGKVEFVPGMSAMVLPNARGGLTLIAQSLHAVEHKGRKSDRGVSFDLCCIDEIQHGDRSALNGSIMPILSDTHNLGTCDGSISTPHIWMTGTVPIASDMLEEFLAWQTKWNHYKASKNPRSKIPNVKVEKCDFYHLKNSLKGYLAQAKKNGNKESAYLLGERLQVLETSEEYYKDPSRINEWRREYALEHDPSQQILSSIMENVKSFNTIDMKATSVFGDKKRKELVVHIVLDYGVSSPMAMWFFLATHNDDDYPKKLHFVDYRQEIGLYIDQMFSFLLNWQRTMRGRGFNVSYGQIAVPHDMNKKDAYGIPLPQKWNEGGIRCAMIPQQKSNEQKLLDIENIIANATFGPECKDGLDILARMSKMTLAYATRNKSREAHCFDSLSYTNVCLGDGAIDSYFSPTSVEISSKFNGKHKPWEFGTNLDGILYWNSVSKLQQVFNLNNLQCRHS